ncbi:hypothetical protein MASR2M48_10130 [Spirochaetota bacterium]
MMKNTQIERDAYDQMKPGLITAQGFLGEDKRSLADIVASDNEAWRRAGTDPRYSGGLPRKDAGSWAGWPWGTDRY